MDGLATAKHTFQGLAVGLLVTIALAGCEPGPVAIPPGAQEIHAIVSGDSVRLEPPTVQAGTIYLVLDEPRREVLLVEAKRTAESPAGPLTDEDLDRIAHGDTFHTSITGGFANGEQYGNVTRLVLAAGKYAFLVDDPTVLAERSGGVIPSESMAVLEVLP